MDNDRFKKKAYAKVNIFLKIKGKRENYHEIVSRFVLVEELYDIVKFEKGDFNEFTLEGDFGCEIKKNTIYKAYLELCNKFENLKTFFNNYKVVVEKKIPEFAGLGGGSSDAATLLIMTNELANLNLSKKELSSIGAKIGSDVPFFIYQYKSANVKGVGEVVEKFEEEVPKIELFTPKIKCDTGKIFKVFRDKFYKEISNDEADKLLSMKTTKILKEYKKEYLNDLYLPAVECEALLSEVDLGCKNIFFSGSGSSFFYLK